MRARRVSVLALAVAAASLGHAPGARAGSTGTTGSGIPFDNMQPSQALHYLVRTGSEDFTNLGEVKLFAPSVVPRGWTPADGRLLPIVDNQNLFALLGTTYGGDGKTMFGLPDLRGRVAIGAGGGPGLTPRQPGEQVGTATVNLTAAQMPAHDHTTPYADPATTGVTGGALPFSNMQPSLALNFAVQSVGEFPSLPGGLGVSAQPMLAQVRTFAGTVLQTETIPPARRIADGALLPISQNIALFSLLGTTFGGDGKTMFGLPDFRGTAGMGWGTGPGLTPRTLGEITGQETTTLSAAQLPAHLHSLDAEKTTGPTGGSQRVANMQPTLGMTYMIATQGIFPTPGNPTAPSTIDTMLGEVGLFGGTFAPTGWEPCDGRLLPISEYDALFFLLGTTYGGDGINTFGLPDLRGRVPIGAGQGPELPNWQPGQTTGVENLTLTAANLPPHAHEVPEAGSLFGMMLAAGLAAPRSRSTPRHTPPLP